VNRAVFEAIRKAVSCEIELGGGIRTLDNAKTVLGIGIDFVVLGSLLTKNFELAQTLILENKDKIIAGIDAKGEQVAVEGWIENSGLTTASLLKRLTGLPLAGVIYTEIRRDGMMSGPNLEALRDVAQRITVPVIASGGVRDVRDIHAIAATGASGCIIGKAILGGHMPLDGLWGTL
jgi:phosphoribosylformimino-5-aminoimidazole carboxamide ribotide isomerase